MGGIGYRLRADFSVRWKGWLLRGVLYGVAAATVLAAIAAARRTDSAYDRFLEDTNAYDVLLPNVPDNGGAIFEPEDVLGLPQVEDGIRLRYTYVTAGTGETALADPSGRLGDEFNRFKVIEGRAFDPDEPGEAVVTFPAAEDDDLEVGDEVSFFADDIPPVRIVGIVAAPGDFPPHFPGEGTIYLSPALARSGALDDENPDGIMVRLEHGAADIPAFTDELTALAGDQAVLSKSQSDASTQPERSIHLQAVAFWILALILGLTAVTLVGQIESRATHAESDDLPTFGALGMSQRGRFAAALIDRLPVATVAALVAFVVSAALSPLSPIGLARIAEPDPGFHIDAVVLGLGALATLALIPILSLPAAWSSARRPAAGMGGRAVPVRHRTPTLANAVAGGPPAFAAGVRLAVEPGGGRDSVPVRSTLLGVTLAVAVVAAALTFGASLRHLLDTPRLFGQVWTTQLTNYGDGLDDAAADFVRAEPGVEAVAIGESGFQVEIDDHVTVSGSWLGAPDDDALPPALDGAPPREADEIGLGASTAKDLGVGVGDTVQVEVPGLAAAMPFRVSGILVLPSGQNTQLGEGALVTKDAVYAFGATDDDIAPDLFVRVSPGTDPDAIAARVPQGESTTGVIALPLDKPNDVVNFGRVDALPAILGGLLVVVAVSTLVHTLISAVRRRRRDLSVMKTVGFVGPQLRAAVRWQAITLVLIALVIGIPVGAVAGRFAYERLADELGVISIPVVPGLALALLVPGAIVLALLAAFVPGRLAGRTRPASVLRAG